jgi:Ca2+-binding RTX toxin-like protein
MFELISSFTYSHGTLIRPLSDGPVTWGVPGANVVFYNTGADYNYGHTFTVTDVRTDGTNTLIDTTMSYETLPTLIVNGIVADKFVVHPAPSLYMSGSSGCADAVDLSQTPAGAPLYSYSSRTYTGDIGDPPAFTIWGKLVSIVVEVTRAYTGVQSSCLFHIGGQFGSSMLNPNDVSVTWDPIIDLKTAGTRTIVPGSVTKFGSDNIPVIGANWFVNAMDPYLGTHLSGDFATADCYRNDHYRPGNWSHHVRWRGQRRRLGAGVETLVLQGSADLQGYGNSLSNSIYGNAGANILDGGVGGDSMIGGAGNDTYSIDNAGDVLVENPNEGFDTVFSTVSLTLTANLENLVLQGSADLQAYGNTLSNSIYGNSGNNIIDGGTSADSMYGGTGDDIYYVDNAGDVVVENANAGADVVFSMVSNTLTANVETLVLQGGGDLQGYGNSLANSLHGNSGNNLLDGGAGADTMYGGAGNDLYFVDNTGDVVFENAGEGADAVFATVDYTLSANVETLVLQGAGNLSGTGNGAANTLHGNSGNNTLNGRGGADVLVGHEGNDTFVFRAGEADGDTVMDFTGNGASAVDSLTFVGFGTVGQGATLTRIGTINQWQIHSGLDGHNEMIRFTNGTTIDASDFLFS